LSAEPLRYGAPESERSFSSPSQIVFERSKRFTEHSLSVPRAANRDSMLQLESPISSAARGDGALFADIAVEPAWKTVSSWSASAAKRVFDCACVLLALPAILPLALVIGAAVRLTSRGPVLFLQKRMGRHGQTFTIFKFRTMIHVVDRAHHPITTSGNQRFTPVGPFLRRLKLDELPQLANVLLGHMSLVGPRPKLPEHVVFDLPCRPGITGMATTVFASEEAAFARVPKDYLDAFYHTVVLPAKWKLDVEYMAQATFVSDLKLLVNTVLRRWDNSVLESYLRAAGVECPDEISPSRVPDPARIVVCKPISQSTNHPAEEGSVG
jgi:lipopolysaccharide/colanic/teichoic acid biosynthesis glycosyltransferase